MLAKFSGFDPKGPYLSLEKETFCVVFTYFVKRAREIRGFHVPVVQRRLRTVQEKYVQSCCFVNLNPFFCFFFVFFFCRSRYCRRRRCLISALLLSSRNLATMVT